MFLLVSALVLLVLGYLVGAEFGHPLVGLWVAFLLIVAFVMFAGRANRPPSEPHP